MSPKIQVQVCSGTACFVMGGSDLLTVFDYLTAEEQKHVSLSAIPCFEHCRIDENSKPPYVLINGSLHDKVTMPSLLNIIRVIIETKRPAR